MKAPPIYFSLLFVFITFVIVSALWFHSKTGHYKGDTDHCEIDKGVVRVLSWSPRTLIYRKFITPEESKYLISLGKGNLQRSTVTNGALEDHRTSNGAFISTDGDPVIMRIEQRIAEWTLLPVEHGESFYLLRYQKGEQYEPHYDYFSGPEAEKHIGNSGQRVKTVIIYLQEPELGGETTFPRANGTIVPKVGDALLFYNVLPNGKPDIMSLHAGNPVIEGEKWVITKWIRAKPYEFNWYAEQQKQYFEQHGRPMGQPNK